MNVNELELIELELLIQAIKKCYGWDFSHYKRASLQRSSKRMVSKYGLNCIAEIIPKLLWDGTFLDELLQQFSIPVTEMFRDPKIFLTMRTKVIPILKTYPFIKVWHAGCAGGEEVYSMAILLYEEGMYEHSRIYGTDINGRALEKAKEGIFDADKYQEYENNYKISGGKYDLGKYFHTQYDAFIINNYLKKNVFFFNHNLVTDQSFGEMNLIMCRNVLIYFDKTLQINVIQLFNESLCRGGFLCLGAKESLDFINVNTDLYAWSMPEKIYRKSIEKTST